MSTFKSDIRRLLDEVYREREYYNSSVYELLHYLEHFIDNNVALEVIEPIPEPTYRTETRTDLIVGGVTDTAADLGSWALAEVIIDSMLGGDD